MATWLTALTDDARRALGGDQRVLEHLPFKVGRESRVGPSARRTDERRKGTAPQLNDIYILETGEVVNVSREHFLIDADGAGHVLVDRGSTLGTIVEGRTIGGSRTGGRTPLRNHDVIIVGTAASPFVFKFRIG